MSARVEGGLQGVSRKVESGLQGVQAQVTAGLQGVQGKVGEDLQGLRAQVGEDLQSAQGRIDESLQGVRGEVGQGLQGVQGRIDAVDEGLAGVRGQVDEGLQGVRGQVDEGLQGVRGQVDEGLQGVRGQVDQGLQEVQGRVDVGMQGVQGRVDEGVQGLRRQIEAGLQDLRRQVEALPAQFPELPPPPPPAPEPPPPPEPDPDELAPGQMREILWTLATEEPRTRRQLWGMRAHPQYDVAYTDVNPLVSVVICTRDRGELLAGKAVPSALAQTHRNIEVVVVGDATGEETPESLARLGDGRIRFRNLSWRSDAAEQPGDQRLVAMTMARNEGTRMARGRWLLTLDDDTALVPEAVEELLKTARENRAEIAYGRVDGQGSFPPVAEDFVWSGALWHGGLRLFDRQLVAAPFGMSGDAFLLQRMLRVGVRMALSDATVI